MKMEKLMNEEHRSAAAVPPACSTMVLGLNLIFRAYVRLQLNLTPGSSDVKQWGAAAAQGGLYISTHGNSWHSWGSTECLESRTHTHTLKSYVWPCD